MHFSKETMLEKALNILALTVSARKLMDIVDPSRNKNKLETKIVVYLPTHSYLKVLLT